MKTMLKMMLFYYFGKPKEMQYAQVRRLLMKLLKIIKHQKAVKITHKTYE